MDALGHMTLVMAKEKLAEQLPKLLPGITGLYKRHTEHYLITQVQAKFDGVSVLDLRGSPLVLD